MKRICLFVLVFRAAVCFGWQVESGSATVLSDGFSAAGSAVVSEEFVLDFDDDPVFVWQLTGYEDAEFSIKLSRPDGSEVKEPYGPIIIGGILRLDPRAVLAWSGEQGIKVSIEVSSGSFALHELGVEYFSPDSIYPPDNDEVTSFIGACQMGFEWPFVEGTDNFRIEYWPDGNESAVQSISARHACFTKVGQVLSAGKWQWRYVAMNGAVVVKTSRVFSFLQGVMPTVRAGFGDVPFVINNRMNGVRSEVVSSGIPFGQGKFFPGGNVSITDNGGRVVAYEYDVLGVWSDGSVKWALFTMPVVIAANSINSYTLSQAEGGYADGESLAAVQGTEIVVDTGLLNATVPVGGLNIFNSVSTASRSGRNLPVSIGIGAIHGANSIDSVTEYTSGSDGYSYIESNGALRAVLVTKGYLRDGGGNVGFSYCIRQIYTSGQCQARLLVTFTCMTGSYKWHDSTLPSVYLDHVTIRVGGVNAEAAYFDQTTEHSRQGGKLILDQMDSAKYEIKVVP